MPKLADKSQCTGCTACASICPRQCIQMKKDDAGFEFPEVIEQSACIACGACERICPVLANKKTEESHSSTFAYAAFSINDSLRMESSSGGVFSELAVVILQLGGIIYGASYDDEGVVRHTGIEAQKELGKLRGAKYSQSILGDSFLTLKKQLDSGRTVLFSGTPCQVAGLRAFLKRDYDNLVCIDFVCHGVPSPMAWDAFIKYRAEKDADGKLPQSINLRSKETGWSKYQYSNVFKYEDGKKNSTVSSQSLFMKLFVGDYISRPSCSNCKFKGYSRISDITLGDFWGIWDIEPEMDDNKGTSVVLVHSHKGETLWKDVDSKIKSKEVTLEQTSQENLSMVVSSKANPNRELALEWIRNGKIKTCEELFTAVSPPKSTLLIRVKGKIKRLLTGK